MTGHRINMISCHFSKGFETKVERTNRTICCCIGVVAPNTLKMRIIISKFKLHNSRFPLKDFEHLL